MSQELERVYTINLGKVLLSPDNQRAKRAINMIKEFARHHMKVEDIRIEEDVAHIIWARGIKHPPRKIRVRLTKTDEGYILVSQYDEEIESAVEPETKEEKIDTVVEEKPEAPQVEAKEEEPESEVKEVPKEAPKKEDKPAKKEAPKKEDKPAKKEAPKKESKKE